MLDFASSCVATAALPPGRISKTVTLSVSTLRAAAQGRCVARARIDLLGRSLVYVSTSIALEASPSDRVATASAVLMITGG